MAKAKYVLAAGAAAAVATATLLPAGAGAATDEPTTPVVVVSHLNNPRQLSLVRDDQLLIAEAGKGGDTAADSPEGTTYFGYSGSISEVTNPQTAANGSPKRIVTNLLSGAGAPSGEFAVGSDGVSSRGRNSAIYIQETYAPPDVLPTPPTSQQVGRLLHAKRDGSFRPMANISRYEKANDPDGHGFDSNPYAVLAMPDGTELVADAAGNDVLRVGGGGISTFHVFKNIRTGDCKGQADPSPKFPGCNFVPTSLATDRQGHVWVGGLASEVPDAGQVVELSADGSTVLRVIHHFTSVSGVAVGANGDVYVSQLEGQEAHPQQEGVVGVLTRVAAKGGRTNVDVPFPAGVAVDSADNVYVSAWSIASEDGFMGAPVSGQVWRLHF